MLPAQSFSTNRVARVIQVRNVPRGEFAIANQAALIADLVLTRPTGKSIPNSSILAFTQNNKLSPVGQTIHTSHPKIHGKLPPLVRFPQMFLTLDRRDYSFRRNDAIRYQAITIAFSIAMSVDRCFDSLHAGDLAVSRQSLGHDLVHVVVLVRRQTADKVNVRSPVGTRFIARVQFRVLFTRNRIVSIALRLLKLVNDARLRVFLSGQILEFRNARVEMLVWIIQYRRRLINRDVVCFVFELERPVRQLAVAIVKVRIDHET